VHIGLYHYKDKKIYYDKWLKKDNEGYCSICGNLTKFESIKYGYKNCCSKKCKDIYAHNRSKEEFKKKYNVDYPLQTELAQINMRKTVNKKYGSDYFVQSRSYRQEMLKRYNVENTLQSPELFNKGFRKRIESGKRINSFKDTNLTYQGSYELDFLEKFYDKIDIENGPSVPYLFEGKNKVYHSDFYIPSKNLVVEIKSDYILSLDKEINEKKKATISNGFNYILILNKNYTELEKLFL
jgi:hypothetical protein